MHKHISKPILPLIVCMLVLATCLPLVGQDAGQSKSNDAKTALDSGITYFGQNRYRDALDSFGKVLSDPRASAQRPDAMYWSALAYLAVGDQTNAAVAIDAFLTAYPTSVRVPDLMYQRARIQYSNGGFESSLKAFSAFMDAAPQSDLFPSALYWSGECLYALGRLEEADRVFAVVIDKYPSSVKVEAASYRRSLIGLEYRERELLKLLTWSHEESLRAVEDFRRKEKAFDQSISIYQKQIADLKRGLPTDQDKLVADLRSQIADLNSKLDDSNAKLAAALSQLAAASAPQAAATPAPAPQPIAVTPPIDSDARTAALAAKARALDLLGFYLEWLAKESAK